MLAVAPHAARANPVDAFGYGARSVSLSGAVTATATDDSANYYNPAGLAVSDDLRIELGYIYVDPTLKMNGGDQDVDRNYGVQGGVVLPGQIARHNVAFSLGLFLPAERISRIRALPLRQPRWVLFDNRPQRLVITTSLALEVIDDLYVGAGLTYLSNTGGTLAMGGVANLFDEEQTAFFSGVDVNLSAVRYPSAGIMFTPGDWSFGLAFRDEFELGLDLTVDVGGDIAGTQGVAVEDASFILVTTSTNLFSPRQLALGAAYSPGRWSAAVDLTWAQWSHFPSEASAIDIDLEFGSLPFELPPTDDPVSPQFRNIVITRVGGEYVAVDSKHFGLTLRGGYSFEPTPADDVPAPLSYIDSAKHGASLGLGFRFSEFSTVFERPILLDLAGSYTRMTPRTYLTDDAASAVGDLETEGHFLGFVSTLSLLFP